jgi:hypothetical protein
LEIVPDSNSLVSTERSFFISWLPSFQTLTKLRQEFIQDGIIPSSAVVLCIELAEDLLQHLPLETGGFLILHWDDSLTFPRKFETGSVVQAVVRGDSFQLT